MTAPNGIHHLALSTGNMKGQIEFFTDVIGMELVALYWIHGVEGRAHLLDSKTMGLSVLVVKIAFAKFTMRTKEVLGLLE